MDTNELLTEMNRKLDILVAARSVAPEVARSTSSYEPANVEMDDLMQSMLADGFAAYNVSGQNLREMLVLTNGDKAAAKANFEANVLKHGSGRARAEWAALGVNDPTPAQIAEKASYHVWVNRHDQGTVAVSVAQGFADALDALDGQ